MQVTAANVAADADLSNDAARHWSELMACFRARDWDGFATRVAEGAVADDRRTIVSCIRMEGRDAIVEMWCNAMATLDGVVQVVLNGAVSLEGPTAARGRWYICEYLRRWIATDADILELGAGWCDFSNQVAAKSGTTDNFVDAWLMAYTPDFVVATWAGHTDQTGAEIGMKQVFGTQVGKAMSVPFVNSLPSSMFHNFSLSAGLTDCTSPDASLSIDRSGCPTPTPTPSPTPSPTPTATPSETAAPTPTPIIVTLPPIICPTPGPSPTPGGTSTSTSTSTKPSPTPCLVPGG